MNPRSTSSWRFFYLCASVTLSLVVFGLFLWKPGIDGYQRAMFGDMVYGRAYKPYVYRTLLPTTVRLVSSAFPQEAKHRLSDTLAEGGAIDNLLKILGWQRRYLIEYLIAMLLMYACLWGFIWSLRWLLAGVYRVSDKVRDVFTLVALVGLTQFFRYYNYLYDLPAVFLFTLGLGLLLRAKWRPYLLVFCLACINKETAILLTVVCAIHSWNQKTISRAHLGNLLTLQVAAFAVIKGALALIFHENQGSFVTWSLPEHNIQLLGAYPISALFGWCGVALLVFYKWHEKPVFLRNGLWIVAPLVVLTFFLGYLDELRDYYEAYPIVALLLLHSVGRICGFDVATLDEPPSDAV